MTPQSDVVVVGGGVIGCAVAWFLAREGVSVRLVERDDVAAHASGAAAGMLLPFGESVGPGAFLELARRGLGLFPELCAELRERSGIDPEFEPSGALTAVFSDVAESAARARARELAADGLEWLDARAAAEVEPRLAPGLRGGVWSPREAHVRSPRLTRAYAAAAAEIGARLERGVAVTGLQRAGDRVTGVETSDGPRAADSVVLCGGAWTPALLAPPPPIEPVRGQILSLDVPGPALRAIVLGERGLYLVPKRDGSLVLGATEERVGFDCRVTARGAAGLLDAGLALLPALADAGFRSAWAGLRPATPDALPLVGPVPGSPGLLVAAGHYRNGVLLSPVTGRLVADLVLGKPLPAAATALRPDRFSSSS